MIQVREYARLTNAAGEIPSLDLGIVSPSMFEWLVSLSEKRQAEKYISLEGRSYLKLDSFVGYLQSPLGEEIEVLPKISNGLDRPELARQVLRKMLCSAMHLSPREAGAAHLQRMDTPLHEWLFGQFLSELNRLVSRGLRFDYERVEEESRFIRGQLNLTAQLKQPLGRANLFHIRHDIFTPNRIENRLLKTALVYVYRSCRNPENWRLANELIHILEPVETLSDPLRVFPHWASNKLLQTYQAVKPWCQLILEKLNPNFQKGMHQGISLMFPMERLFESHVAACLNKKLNPPWLLKVQAASEYLVKHQPENTTHLQNWFNLQPDLMLTDGRSRQIMDTKWKLLNESALFDGAKYNLSQQDFYQLFAYGQKYQSGAGDMMLIYPQHETFRRSLPCFHFDKLLRLWVVPFCIEKDKLIEGDWLNSFPALLDGSFDSTRVSATFLR